MGWVTGIVVYFLVWWTVLFAVLPLGIRPAEEGDAVSGWRGAPRQVRMWRIVLLTTAVSAVVFAGIYALVSSDVLSFRSGWLAKPND